MQGTGIRDEGAGILGLFVHFRVRQAAGCASSLDEPAPTAEYQTVKWFLDRSILQPPE